MTISCTGRVVSISNVSAFFAPFRKRAGPNQVQNRSGLQRPSATDQTCDSGPKTLPSQTIDATCPSSRQLLNIQKHCCKQMSRIDIGKVWPDRSGLRSGSVTSVALTKPSVLAVWARSGCFVRVQTLNRPWSQSSDQTWYRTGVDFFNLFTRSMKSVQCFADRWLEISLYHAVAVLG